MGTSTQYGGAFMRMQTISLLSVDADTVHYGYDAESRLGAVTNAAFTAACAYTPDGLDAGWTVTCTNGMPISRALTRDPYRRRLVAAITNAVGQSVVSGYCYVYDLLGRAIARNSDTFDYNDRSEVTAAFIEPSNTNRYEYDGIGNNRWTTVNNATNTYTVNALNQYSTIANGATIVPSYDMDGNMRTNGVWSYTWDAENRLSAVYSNAALVVSNAYDPMSRRVLKITPTATHTFVYDGWNLAQETIATASGVTTNRYVWGKDLSGTMQGAGGVGGLLAVSLNGPWFFPFYDNNGNITAYVAESGNLVAEYVFDAFGRSISQSGPMANNFSFRFSTKYYDTATGLYYYGYRFYSPQQGRWINRDPIDEESGVHLYAFCFNHSINGFDLLGLDSYLLFWGDEDGVPFQQAAIGKKSQIEASRGFNSKTDQIVIIAARSFNDIQNTLKQNKCIKEIHFYVHAGPGIMFLDMTSQANDSNVSINGGTHTIRESDFVIKYKTRGVKELDSSNMKKFKKWQIFSKNKVYVHGCNSSSIANSLGKHLNASGDGVDGTCYYPIVDGVPIPATGRYYFWLLMTGQIDKTKDRPVK